MANNNENVVPFPSSGMTPHGPDDCEDCGVLHGAASAHRRERENLPTPDASLQRIFDAADALRESVNGCAGTRSDRWSMSQRRGFARAADLAEEAYRQMTGPWR